MRKGEGGGGRERGEQGERGGGAKQIDNYKFSHLIN